MKPFFSYYGAKWTVAKHLGPPRQSLVVEPFAGSACYSTRWEPARAFLCDVSDDIVTLWDWLIKCSAADVSAIPSSFEDIDQVLALERPQRLLVGFWVAKGRAEVSGQLSPWYFQHRNEIDCKVWGPAVKARILKQKPSITGWRAFPLSYDEIPDFKAHWHVDPPYAGSVGRRYPHSDINYSELAAWCRSRRGSVDVCENDGADWLPFERLCEVVSSRGRRDGHRSVEAVCRMENLTTKQ